MAMQQEIFSRTERKRGEELLRSKRVNILQFSEGTYQFEVKETPKGASFFPFLHVNDTGKIIDCFCTCPTVEKKSSCPHLAASYLKIFKGGSEPLHLRFQRSLWNRLCFLAGARHHFASDAITLLKGGGVETRSQTEKILFAALPLTREGKKKLKEFCQRGPETEQTSIKFSNLSPEEIALWKQGRPSQTLLYRLSFFSDLAAYLFLLQDEGVRYRIYFLTEPQDLPKGIRVVFPTIEATFYLSSSNWSQVVPALKTVESSLKIFDSQYSPIQAIRYEPSECALYLDHEPLESRSKTTGSKKPLQAQVIEIEDWFFLPKKGFFPLSVDPSLGQLKIEKEEVSHFIDAHRDLIATTLQKVPIDFRVYPVQYHLSFIPQQGLKIAAYVFDKGDLEEPLTSRFGSWVYTSGRGFFKIESLIFPQVSTVIPSSSLGEFIESHRLFLHSYEGFQPHRTTVESALHFFLDSQGFLHFQMRMEENHEEEGFIDLGEWIYVPTRGFYPKTKNQGYLRPGLIVGPDKIVSFIKNNRDELETLKGFFSTRCPLTAAGLFIYFDSKEHIVVKPHYELAPSYSMAEAHLLGEVTYVAGEGFCLLPFQLVIPAGYRKKRTIGFREEEAFITSELSMLQSYSIEIDDRLVEPRSLRLCMKDIDVTSRHSIWRVELVYISELGEVPLQTVLEARKNGRRYLCSAAGLLYLEKLQFAWLQELDEVQNLREKLTLSSLECMKLLAFEQVIDADGYLLTVEAWFALTDSKIKHKHFSLEGLKSNLRPYQKVGVEWLWQLYLRGLSGLLCDEMGLGKTHQAMALMAAIYHNQEEKSMQPILVVCPTSVIFHWEEILRKFLPTLRVIVYYGITRSLLTLRRDVHIIITSYGILRSEKKLLKEMVFSLAVFDEIQAAKNPLSQTHQVLKIVQADMRLGLTGTPIENHLSELKALFDVVLPGYLPSEDKFKIFLSSTIESAQDVVRREILQRLIRPFILRRKKRDVLVELPEKTEEIAHCILKKEQQKLYDALIIKEGKEVIKQLINEEKPVPYMHVFALLTKLKQICDHPSLVLKNSRDYFQHESGKWDLFVELLTEARESGQKVVVFSQFIKMLDIIEAYLSQEKIGFAGIRGATRDRGAQVAKFRDDPKCEVFVASLQAAGVGIDLIAASVVIHYDRWWNPAKENQATDRVHRMGQNRGVQVFKLVTKETIEERIDAMINRKMALLQTMIGYDEQDELKALDRYELIELLKQTRPERNTALE